MEGSKSRFSGAIKATAIVACAALTTFTFARALDAVGWSGLYDNNFSFVPGHWFRSQLTLASIDPADTCVLLGASVVREGFDSEVLSRAAPGIKFVNLATTGGFSPMDIVDIQSRILAENGGKYRCIVLGMNNFYLRNFDQQSYELVTTDYLSQLPLAALADLLPWLGGNDKNSLVTRLLLPFGKNSVIAQRWWRYAIYKAREFISDGSVAMAAYETQPNEFMPARQFQYVGLTSPFEANIARARAEFAQHQLENPASYSSSSPGEVMRDSIQRLSALSDHVIVVTMPLSSVYRTVEKVAKPKFDASSEMINTVTFIKCEIGYSEERSLFYDTSHLNEEGRRQLSASMAALIQRIVQGGSYKVDLDLCSPDAPPPKSTLGNG
jgi:hypothetical protein